jgi:hypothetical protein
MNWYKSAQNKTGTSGSESARTAKATRCWKGYRKAGLKRKGGRLVNNCVPK